MGTYHRISVIVVTRSIRLVRLRSLEPRPSTDRGSRMTRRFEVGPVLVALGAIVLLVSLFMDWYGPLTAWEAFEVVELLLAILAVAALVVAAGLLVPDIEYLERRWLPAIVLGVVVLVAAALVDPPPAAGEDALDEGAWL